MVCEEGRAGGDLTTREANTFPDCNLRLSQPEHILSRLLHTLIKLRVLQRAYAESNVSDWSNSLFTPRRPPRELRAGWRKPRRRNRLHPNPVFPHLIKPCVPRKFSVDSRDEKFSVDSRDKKISVDSRDGKFSVDRRDKNFRWTAGMENFRWTAGMKKFRWTAGMNQKTSTDIRDEPRHRGEWGDESPPPKEWSERPKTPLQNNFTLPVDSRHFGHSPLF